jgi:glycogen operon protein
MLLAGDEIGRTQQGNNNAYCQDNEISWIDWDLCADRREMLRFVRRLIALRRRHPVLRKRRFLHGRAKSRDGAKDIAWYTPHGEEKRPEQWRDPHARCIGLMLDGRAGPDLTEDGQPMPDEVLLLLMNAHHGEVPFVLPRLRGGSAWRPVLSTAQPDAPATSDRLPMGRPFAVPPQSLLLLACDLEARAAP